MIDSSIALSLFVQKADYPWRILMMKMSQQVDSAALQLAEKLAEHGCVTAKGNPYDAKQIRRWIKELKEDGAL